MPTTIYSQQLSADGLSVVGPAHRLIGATQSWEGNLVEGPSMMQSGTTYWLFYSANMWGTDNYGIGVARCASVVGPCTKPLDHAWLSSTASGGQSDPGPGGEEFFQVGGLIWMVHHGLAPGQGGDNAQRRLYVDLLAFPNGQVPASRPPATGRRLGRGAPLLRRSQRAATAGRGVPGLAAQGPERVLGDTDQTLVADGQLACAGLAHEKNADEVINSLTARGLDHFEASLVGISATEYFCQQDSLQALKDVQQELAQGSELTEPRYRHRPAICRDIAFVRRDRSFVVEDRRTPNGRKEATAEGGGLRRRPPCRNFGGDPRSQELAGRIVERAGRIAALHREQLADIAEFDEAESWRGDGAVSMIAWVTAQCRRQQLDRPPMGALGLPPEVVAPPGGGAGVGRAVAGPGGAVGRGRLAFGRCRLTGGLTTLERQPGA